MNKELKLDKLSEYTHEELQFFVKLLAGKLERRTEELAAIQAKISGKIGYGSTKNPNVR